MVLFISLKHICFLICFRKLEEKIRAKMSERNDYQAYYYRPVIAKYHRISKEAADELKELRGD